MDAKSFIRTWVAACFVTAMAIAAFNIAVDPYLFYDSPKLARWTAIKPRIYQQVGMAKTYQLERIKPRTVLLGSSRVEIGLDPESANWPANARPVFNAAIAGRDLSTAAVMLREAIAVSSPEMAVVGLDIQDFIETPTPASAVRPVGSDEARLLVDRYGNPNSGRLLQVWRDRGTVTLMIDAFYDSVATLLDQNPATSVTMTPFGFNPLNEYHLFVERSGYFQLFAQRNAASERSYRGRPKLDFSDLTRQANFRYLRQIMDIASEHRIPLILYIHPYHSDYLEMLHRLGFWETFENWKRALVRVVDAQHAAILTRLYDFSDYNEITTEPVPPKGDTHAEMRWYWEAGHYKSALGNEVLATFFGRHEFGRLLTPQNIEASLAAIREHRELFHSAGNVP